MIQNTPPILRSYFPGGNSPLYVSSGTITVSFMKLTFRESNDLIEKLLTIAELYISTPVFKFSD